MNNNLQVREELCIFRVTKLTAKVRLKPIDKQAKFLLDTLQEANAGCNYKTMKFTWFIDIAQFVFQKKRY